MTKYAAFLRGINVGGNKPVKMDELKKIFKSLGFVNAKTILASGNVLFEAKHQKANILAGKIEKCLKKNFGSEINVIVRLLDELQNLIDQNPFSGINLTPDKRFYVTFLSAEPQSKLNIPYESPDKSFRIFRVTEKDICSVLTITDQSNTIDLMGIIEKEFGKKVTTRNWNTIMKFFK